MPDLKTLPGFPPGGLNDDGPVLRANPDTQDGGIGLPGGKLEALAGATEGVTELDGYRERHRTYGDQSVTRVFAVPWSKREQWRDEMLGYSYSSVIPGSSNYALKRVIPAQVPEGGLQHLYCSELNLVEGRGAWVQNPDVALPMIAYVDSGDGSDGSAVFEAVYTPRPYRVLTDDELAALSGGKGELERNVERSMRRALQAVALPKGQVKFGVPTVLSGSGETVPATVSGVAVSGQTIPDNAAFILMPTAELRWVWWDVPDLNWPAVEACEGKVNSAPFDGALGCLRVKADGTPDPWPAYTLLCQPVEFERYRNCRGRFTHKLTVSALYRRQTWLRLPAGVDKNFYAVTYANGDALFEQADFAQLFTPGAPLVYQ